MSKSRFSCAPKHACDLGDPGLTLDGEERGLGAGIPDLLADEELSRCRSRHLREVGDAEDLMTSSEFGHLDGHASGDLAADICIDLIKNEEGDLVLSRECRLERQHDTGDFTA